MNVSSRAAALVLATLAVLTGCPAEEKPSTLTPTAKLTITRSVTEVVANGTNTVDINVTGGTVAPITVLTSKGTFTTGGASATISGTSGTVTLLSCNAATPGCVGAAAITATDGAGVTGTSSVTFTTAEICNNGVDDDGDAAADCEDTTCALNVACDTSGHVCAADRTCTKCGGGGGVAEATETSCTDGFDNDCDGDADCADTDCNGKACTTGTDVGLCQGGACSCSKTEPSENSCGDGVDNDCDGNIDCDDPNCAGRLCDAVRGLACGGTPTTCATCQGGQTTELATQCADGKDNDCDGTTDCDDADCAGRTCNLFGGVCAAAGTGYTCACAGSLMAETDCADGEDNDCNGKVDCADPNCDLQQCGATAAFTCEANSCVDGATRYSVSVTAARERLPATADATSVITLEVKLEGAPAVGMLMDLTVVPSSLGIVNPTTVSTDGAGMATFNFVATGDVGLAEVVATIRGVGTSGSTVIEMPALGEIRVASVQYNVMGVEYSGYQEQNNLAVELLDMEAQPYPEGLTVRFEHLTLGGSALSGDPTADIAGQCEDPWCVGTNTATDENGLAGVTLYSGTVAGTVPVTAIADAGGLPARVFDLPTVAIIGARASGAHLSVVCDPLNVPALAATTCYTSLVDSPFHCVAVLKDRFNNTVGRATTVTFMSEGGAVGQPATTPAYDATKDPVSQANLGIAREVIPTLGNKLPKDVPPHQGAANPYGIDDLQRADNDPRWEYALDYDDNRCLPGVHNPRDGAVTVVASTPGEEAFFDSNGNGVYDGEPCTDADRDGVWCEDREFTDANRNGLYDGEPCNDTNLNGVPGEAGEYTDTNGNGLYDDNGEPCTDADLDGVWCETGEYTDANVNGKWDSEPFIDLPEPYIDYDDNNNRDADEPFIDSNGDGIWNRPNGRWDSTAKIWTQTRVVFSGTPEASAFTGTTQSFSRWMTLADVATFPAPTNTPTFTVAGPSAILDVNVAVTDGNFNPIAGETPLGLWSFGETIDPYTGYYGVDAALDTLGFTYVYWPCDASDPTYSRCANDCAYAASPPPARCVMRSVLRGYQYGYIAPVRFYNPESPITLTTTYLLGAGNLRIPQAVRYTP